MRRLRQPESCRGDGCGDRVAVGSSLAIYPHSLSYFNELAGGPTKGHYHLIDSNIDWG